MRASSARRTGDGSSCERPGTHRQRGRRDPGSSTSELSRSRRSRRSRPHISRHRGGRKARSFTSFMPKWQPHIRRHSDHQGSSCGGDRRDLRAGAGEATLHRQAGVLARCRAGPAFGEERVADRRPDACFRGHVLQGRRACCVTPAPTNGGVTSLSRRSIARVRGPAAGRSHSFHRASPPGYHVGDQAQLRDDAVLMADEQADALGGGRNQFSRHPRAGAWRGR